ncbi:MAG: phenylacetate-CoA oxygenase subunit PaaJ [Chitinophagales bacterium]|nr:MAG: phenylacetate-CoA oxygenase subunit PaaJ [Chitinophagales bacterium]
MALPSGTDILEVLREVKDPEIPVLSVVDMGIIRNVLVDKDSVVIHITPTYTGCPALALMQQQIREKVESMGFSNVAVLVDREHPWSTDDITETGRVALQKYGLAPPPASTAADKAPSPLTCPHCQSSNTSMTSLFGSSLCRAIYYCHNCKLTFEYMKPK